MREYGKVTPRFWTGRLGEAIRGKERLQALSSYLVNCPHGNMIGLFHLPLAYVQADLGWPIPKIQAALADLPRWFVEYDHDTKRVLVVEAWRIELCTDDMAPDDNRRRKVASLLRPHLESDLVARFLDRYPATRQSLVGLIPLPEPLPKPLPKPLTEPLDSPFEAPSEGDFEHREAPPEGVARVAGAGARAPAAAGSGTAAGTGIPPQAPRRGASRAEPAFNPREIGWRVNESWAAHVEAWRRHCQAENGASPGPEPTCTPEILESLQRALRVHDRHLLGAEQRDEWKRDSKVRAAGIGIFLSDWHTGHNPKNDRRNGGKTYLEHWRPWKVQRGKGDPVDGFAELYFRERARAPRG